MQVFRGIPERAPLSCVLTIGNFDGVHLGHQALLAELRAVARRVALPAAVLTFEPHPREFFAPESAPARLTSLREKMLLLDGQGVDHLYICRFNARLAGLSAEDFVERVLVQGLSTRHLIIGDDFRFGKARRGDFAHLQRAGIEYRFGVEAMRTVMVGDERASSSAIRRLLALGDMAHAARLLGRPYSIAGRVVHGNKLGRKLGFPTANIQLKRIRLALAGIFAVTVEGIDAQPLPGVASLGLRPTVEGDGRFHLEVHLFDFDRELYDAHLRVKFLHKLRDEAKYDSLDALTAQISRDCEQARTFLSQMS